MELKNILCPLDGTELMDKVEDAAQYLAKISNARIILLYVVEKWYRSEGLVTNSPEWVTLHEKWLDDGRKILEGVAGRLKAAGVKHIETVLEDGDAAYEIVALANQKNVDLIVMATKKYSHLGRLFSGSRIDMVSKKSPCPVLWLFA